MRSGLGFFVHFAVHHFDRRHVNGSWYNDPAALEEEADPAPDEDTLKFLETHISKVEAQKESNQFAAVWLRSEEEFKYEPHSKDSEDDPLLDTKNPFSPNPTVKGQTYIVARQKKKSGDPYTTHAEKFIWLEVNTFSETSLKIKNSKQVNESVVPISSPIILSASKTFSPHFIFH